MKQLNLLLLMLMLLISYTKVRAQNKNYYKYVCAGTNEATDELFREYAAQFGHFLERDLSIDSFVYKRASYFIRMLQLTVDSHGTIHDAFRKMPSKDSAQYCHDDYFGRPDYFIKPVNLNYEEVDFLKVPRINGYKLTSEVMYFICWSKVCKKRMDKDTVMKDMYRYWHKSEHKPLSLIMFDGYIDSKPHHEAIIEDGNGKYGMVTLALLVENKISNNLWEYEVMMINMVNFTRRGKKHNSHIKISN